MMGMAMKGERVPCADGVLVDDDTFAVPRNTPTTPVRPTFSVTSSIPIYIHYTTISYHQP